MNKRNKILIACFVAMLAIGIGYQNQLSKKQASSPDFNQAHNQTEHGANTHEQPPAAQSSNDVSPSESSSPLAGNESSKSLTPDNSAPDSKDLALVETRSPALSESTHSPPQTSQSGDPLHSQKNTGKFSKTESSPSQWHATAKYSNAVNAGTGRDSGNHEGRSPSSISPAPSNKDAAKQGVQDILKQEANLDPAVSGTKIGMGYVVPFSPKVTGGESASQNGEVATKSSQPTQQTNAAQKNDVNSESGSAQNTTSSQSPAPAAPITTAAVAVPTAPLSVGEKIGKLFGLGGSDKKTSPSAPAPAPGALPNLATTTPAEEKPVAPKAPEGCFSVSFKHDSIASHNDGELCTQHKNLVTIPLEDGMTVNSKSLCVRVNGTPVKFGMVKGSPGKIVVGSVAGPNAVISARFCTASISCNEDCNIPKDDFLSAIGGSANDSENEDLSGPIVQWDPAKDSKTGQPSKVERELERELTSFKAELKGANLKDKAVFTGWQSKGKAGPACQGSKVSSAK